MTLSNSVIAEDQRLDTAATRSSEELAQHRWHWTLDESNPNRVTFVEYAAAVGRSHVTISKQANGYAAWFAEQGREEVPLHGLAEHVERANIGAEKQQAIDAVAKATGKTFQAIRKGGADVVRDVLSTARERVERGNDATMEDAIQRVAEDRARHERTQERVQSESKARHTFRYVELEGHIAYAMRRLREALDVAQDVPFEDEERELIADSLAKLRAVLNLIDVRVTGTTMVDWDSELAKLGEAR